jgi:hypothetical protein
MVNQMDRRLPRVVPPLIKKQTVVKLPTQVKIVIQPSKNRSVIHNNPIPEPPKPANAVPVRTPEKIDLNQRNVVTQRQHSLTKKTPKKTGVRYITTEVAQDSIEKVKSLKNKGVGRLLIIVGNGPTLNEIPTERLRNHSHIDVMSVNKPDKRLWPTKFWSFFDMSQFRRNEDLWNSYDGIIINSTAIKRQKQSGLQVKNLGGKGFSRDLVRGLHIGRSSVFASMQLAYWINYSHVYILGCDMNPDGIDGKLHFYGTNPDVDPAVRKERFGKEAEYYDHAAEILSHDERTKFTFVSSVNNWPFVLRFNKMEHEGSVDKILAHADKLLAHQV